MMMIAREMPRSRRVRRAMRAALADDDFRRRDTRAENIIASMPVRGAIRHEQV